MKTLGMTLSEVMYDHIEDTLEGIIKHQEMKSTFLAVQKSSYGDVELEVGQQASQLNDTICRN